ncbi:hypothetical protein GIB67_027037 [Kingdonia uniflora]|uniref:Myb-like domain-containing protein n=1 Tax=Kingdonia uniflora TaxID=39325 RepID=A0A7J7P286_9MAGN|nr:hypothetical protein GIB67_027037 [Kingdonia uniflora]
MEVAEKKKKKKSKKSKEIKVANIEPTTVDSKKAKTRKKKKDDDNGGTLEDNKKRKNKERENERDDDNGGILKDVEAGLSKEDNKKRKKKRKRENEREDDVELVINKETKKKKKKWKINKEDDIGSKKGNNTKDDAQLGSKKENVEKDEAKVKEHNKEKNKKDVVESNEANVSETMVGENEQMGKRKGVTFSNEEEVFVLPEEKLVRGKRFSQEEDELIKKSVFDYLQRRSLDEEEGIKMVLQSKKHKEVRHCWKEIGDALPWRPKQSVCHRAHILFERSEKRKWTEEEKDAVRKFHEHCGSDWKVLADELQKHRSHVKDTWRRIKLPSYKKGNVSFLRAFALPSQKLHTILNLICHWSQEEYQNLYDLVNFDLQMKIKAERRTTQHGMIRDNICWGAISDTLGTRTNSDCCTKWYKQLASPLVKDGKWADADDYELLSILNMLDASCMEDVDWDNLLENRDGEVCRKRWKEMTRHLGELSHKPFADQVEVLSKRYCPDMLEVREAYDRIPKDDS